MKQRLILFFLCCALFASAQSAKTWSTISYQVDTVRIDSFYLIETISTYSESAPRPELKVTQYLLRSRAEYDNLVSMLTAQASDFAQKAEAARVRAGLLSDLKKKEPWLTKGK